MRLATALALTLASFGILNLSIPPIPAIEFTDGRVSFAKSPRLLDVVTTYDTVGVSFAKYYFTLELPDNAGEPLQAVVIQQRQGTEDVDFRLDETFAFLGQRRHRGENLTLQGVTLNEQENTIKVTFEPPIAPGSTFTIGLKPRHNPRFAGVYLFGVTAIPVGEKPYDLYLGAGRLHFYDNHDRFNY